MGSSIIKYILLMLILCIAKFSCAQNIFNKAFDEGDISNTTPNALEAFGKYYFVQKIFKNGNTHLEAVIIDTVGAVLLKDEIVTNSTLNIYYGYPGSLQILSSQELCQLYHTALDSAVNLIFFDENLNVIRDVQYDFGYFLNAAVIRQINDSTLITLGRIQNSSTFDLFLINTDLQGNERWRTIFGEAGKDDYGFAIENINNKILVSGNSKDLGPHLYEFNMNGNLTFDTIYSNYDFGICIKYHPLHGLFFLVDNKITGSSVSNPAILKLNSNYGIEWSKNYFKDEQFVYLQQLTINDFGIISLAGGKYVNNEFVGLFFQTNQYGDSLGSKLIDHIPGKRAQFHDIRPTSDGGYIMAGETHIPSQDSWIVKVNAWGCDNIPCVVGINEQPTTNDGTLNCYPNPSNGTGVIKGSFKYANYANEIKIFNSLGQLVFSKTIVAKEFEMEVNLPSSGLYLVNLYQRDMVVKSLKWVVK